jgi:pyruvate dehydrogenase kinase 2/3/4
MMSSQRTAATSAPQQAVVQATNIVVRQPPMFQQMQQAYDYNQIDRILFSSLSTGELQSLDMKMLHEIEQHQQDASSVFDLKDLHELAAQKPTPLSLSDMYKYASAATGTDCWSQRIRNAQFLHKELKIRMAQRAVDLLTLPHGLNEATPIRNVAHVYLKYLKKFEACPSPTNPEEEQRFTDMLQSMVLDRTSIPMAIARGVAAWQDDRREHLEFERMQEMEEALYRFFTARVGLRFLTEHHILSSPNLNLASRQKHAVVQGRSIKKQETHDYIGCIQKNCDPVYEIEQVMSEVTRQTLDCYGVCPKIQVVDCSTSDVEFTYVPHHLHYMLAELMKNSCRATVKR